MWSCRLKARQIALLLPRCCNRTSRSRLCWLRNNTNFPFASLRGNKALNGNELKSSGTGLPSTLYNDLSSPILWWHLLLVFQYIKKYVSIIFDISPHGWSETRNHILVRCCHLAAAVMFPRVWNNGKEVPTIRTFARPRNEAVFCNEHSNNGQCWIHTIKESSKLFKEIIEPRIEGKKMAIAPLSASSDEAV